MFKHITISMGMLTSLWCPTLWGNREIVQFDADLKLMAAQKLDNPPLESGSLFGPPPPPEPAQSAQTKKFPRPRPLSPLSEDLSQPPRPQKSTSQPVVKEGDIATFVEATIKKTLPAKSTPKPLPPAEVQSLTAKPAVQNEPPKPTPAPTPAPAAQPAKETPAAAAPAEKPQGNFWNLWGLWS